MIIAIEINVTIYVPPPPEPVENNTAPYFTEKIEFIEAIANQETRVELPEAIDREGEELQYGVMTGEIFFVTLDEQGFIIVDPGLNDIGNYIFEVWVQDSEGLNET